MGGNSNNGDNINISSADFGAVAGKIGLAIAQSFASNLVTLLNNGQLGPTIGSTLVGAMGMDPSSGPGAMAAGMIGGFIQRSAYAGVNYVTNTHNSPLQSSHLAQADTYTGALKTARTQHFIDEITKAQLVGERRMSKLSDEEQRRAYIAGDINAVGGFDASKYARQRVIKAFQSSLGVGVERATELADSGAGVMLRESEQGFAESVQKNTIRSMLANAERNGMYTYDPKLKRMRKATSAEFDGQLGRGSAILTNMILQARDSGNLGSASAEDISNLTRLALAREGSSPDVYTVAGAKRVTATITQMAQSTLNIRDMTGKNTTDAEAYRITRFLTGDASVGAGLDSASYSGAHRAAMLRSGLSFNDYKDAIAKSSAEFKAMGLNLSTADANALGMARHNAFGAGINMRTAGLSNEALEGSQNKLIADVHASGADNTYMSAYRAWCDKNGKDPNDPKSFAEFKNIAGSATSSSELAARAKVDEAAILEYGSDSETRRLSWVHDAAGHIARAQVDEAVKYASDSLDSDTKKAFEKSGIELGRENASQMREKLQAAGYSQKDISKFLRNVDNAYSIAGSILDEGGEHIRGVIENLNNPKDAANLPNAQDTTEQGNVVDAMIKGKGNFAETMQLVLTGYKVGSEKIDNSAKDVSSKLEKLGNILGGPLGDAIIDLSKERNGGSSKKKDKK